MAKLYRLLCILNVILAFTTACSGQTVQAEPSPPQTVTYKDVLGKSLHDKAITDFIAANNCSSAAQFQLCAGVGVALWIGPAQSVETVYLYLNNTEGFGPYEGELPFGLKFYDTMGAAEYKLGRKGIGNAGLPDSGDTPDHLHYWANYQQASMTIVYNTFSPEDEDATIYAILVSQ